MKSVVIASILTLATPVLAMAQAAGQPTGQVTVVGSVPALCSSGAISGGTSVFDLGVLIDTSTGYLLPSLSAPSKTLSGAFCNAQSTITISAAPMTAQNQSGPVPNGFTNGVDFVATASGWTTAAASTSTSASTQPNAVQQQPSPRAADIVVSLSTFTARGGNLRLVSDEEYRGSVIVTLAAVN